jgi:hypothetical protein
MKPIFLRIRTKIQSIGRFAADLLILTCVVFIAPVRAEDCAFKTPPGIVVGKELMITDLSVVNNNRAVDVSGAWSFGHLIAAIGHGEDNERHLIKNWLSSWSEPSSVNGFPLGARPAVTEKIMRSWMAKDGAPTVEAWVPRLDHAPFRLLAIVYRPDLGIVSKDDTIVNAGEVRFVFSALDLKKTSDLDRSPPIPFTLIFEYALPASNRDQVKEWAERWHALGKLPFGDQFNEALEKIVTAFDGSSGSGAFARLRTNDGLALPWQLREFHFDSKNNELVHAPVSNTPHLNIIGQASELSAYVNANRGADIPLRFIGGNADVPDKQFRWPRMDISNNILRHNFALLTCNGCHGGETGTKASERDIRHAGFRHVGGRLKDEEASLSEFLTGTPAVVTDPTGKIQTFCDLKVRERAMFEALNPVLPSTAASSHQPVDLSVARSRQDRTD